MRRGRAHSRAVKGNPRDQQERPPLVVVRTYEPDDDRVRAFLRLLLRLKADQDAEDELPRAA